MRSVFESLWNGEHHRGSIQREWRPLAVVGPHSVYLQNEIFLNVFSDTKPHIVPRGEYIIFVYPFTNKFLR